MNAQDIEWDKGEARLQIGDTGWTLVLVRSWLRAASRHEGLLRGCGGPHTVSYFSHDCNMLGISPAHKRCTVCKDPVPKKARMIANLLYLETWDDL